MSENAKVAILMGSKSDLSQLESGIKILKEFNVPFVVRVMSAHRTPAAVQEFVTNAPENGIKIFIAAAGCAAHLAGVVAAHTTLPVIGIPIESPALKGMDSLLSTVQMPGGIPVATVSIGSAGAKNAALLATQILALSDENLADAMKKYRADMAIKIAADDTAVQLEINS